MKTFLKILIAIIVVAALCGGVYLVLPETAQIFVKGYFQYKTDDVAKEKIDSLKKNEIKYADVQKSGVEKTVNTGLHMETPLQRRLRLLYGTMRSQRMAALLSHIMVQRSAWILQNLDLMEHTLIRL